MAFGHFAIRPSFRYNVKEKHAKYSTSSPALENKSTDIKKKINNDITKMNIHSLMIWRVEGKNFFSDVFCSFFFSNRSDICFCSCVFDEKCVVICKAERERGGCREFEWVWVFLAVGEAWDLQNGSNTNKAVYFINCMKRDLSRLRLIICLANCCGMFPS